MLSSIRDKLFFFHKKMLNSELSLDVASIIDREESPRLALD